MARKELIWPGRSYYGPGGVTMARTEFIWPGRSYYGPGGVNMAQTELIWPRRSSYGPDGVNMALPELIWPGRSLYGPDGVNRSLSLSRFSSIALRRSAVAFKGSHLGRNVYVGKSVCVSYPCHRKRVTILVRRKWLRGGSTILFCAVACTSF